MNREMSSETYRKVMQEIQRLKHKADAGEFVGRDDLDRLQLLIERLASDFWVEDGISKATS